MLNGFVVLWALSSTFDKCNKHSSTAGEIILKYMILNTEVKNANSKYA